MVRSRAVVARFLHDVEGRNVHRAEARPVHLLDMPRRDGCHAQIGKWLDPKAEHGRGCVVVASGQAKDPTAVIQVEVDASHRSQPLARVVH
jgi:hypothetical protein